MKNLQFVPVDKGVSASVIHKQAKKDLYVVELDVEPDSQVKRSIVCEKSRRDKRLNNRFFQLPLQICKKMLFKIIVKRPGAKGNKRNPPKQKGQGEATYFLRNGANTQSFKSSDNDMFEVVRNCIERREREVSSI